MNCFLWTEASKTRNLLTEKYEPLQPFLFLSFLEFAGVKQVLDVGSNVGLYTLLSSLSGQVERVLSFEPDEAAYQELHKNIQLNALDNKIELMKAAVSNVGGQVSFGSHSPMSGVNGVVDTSIHESSIFKEVRNVSAVTLDQIPGLRGKTLGIKIDVEGHELKVIEGASELLQASPALVQVEHYLGSGIDEALSKLGYFSFYVAGHDHYFTNITSFKNPFFVKRAVEYATSWLIETHSGRWPQLETIQNSLHLVSKTHKDQIYAEATLKEGYFAEPEFAFYLMVDGKKVDQQWYEGGPSVTFKKPIDADSIEVKSFVREKKLPEKKVVVGSFIKKPAEGYRAESAVDESMGLPSTYSSLVNTTSSTSSFEKLDLQPFLDFLLGSNKAALVGLGDAIDLSAAAQFGLAKDKSGSRLFLCSSQHYQWLKTSGSSLVGVSKVDTRKDFFSRLHNFLGTLTREVHLLLRAQYLADLAINLEELEGIFSKLPQGTHLYSEALANASFKNQLKMLADHYSFKLTWLYPKAEIHTLAQSPGEINAGSVDFSLKLSHQGANAAGEVSSLHGSQLLPDRPLKLNF